MQSTLITESGTRPFFCAPQVGRKITAGFSYKQRIGKHASTDFWLADAQKRFLSSDAEWAAVRHFDLLREGDNLVIDELDVTDMRKSHDIMMSMRAGGYRMTVITLGTYCEDTTRDDLAIFDKKLQDEIALLINFLYLDELSEKETKAAEALLANCSWNYKEALPHIARALGERQLFKPELETKEEKTFFTLLDKISEEHIIHEAAVGLVLPDATKEKNWTYIAKGENRFSCFHNTVNSVLRGVGEDLPAMTQPRGYGDHTRNSMRDYETQALMQLAA